MSEVGKFVNVYLIEREFGGPEEGGWWYDTGEPILSLRIERWDSWEGNRLVETLRDEFWIKGSELMFEDRCKGDYMVIVEDHAAVEWPTHKPVYE